MRKQEPNNIFDGFCHRDYDEKTDGWMMEQLDDEDFPSVAMARDMLEMFNELNAARREIWRLKKRIKRYEDHCGW